MASQYGGCEGNDAKKNAGSTVTVGIGQVSVGIPREKHPIHAKNTSPRPIATVWYEDFIPPCCNARRGAKSNDERQYGTRNCCKQAFSPTSDGQGLVGS